MCDESGAAIGGPTLASGPMSVNASRFSTRSQIRVLRH